MAKPTITRRSQRMEDEMRDELFIGGSLIGIGILTLLTIGKVKTTKETILLMPILITITIIIYLILRVNDWRMTR